MENLTITELRAKLISREISAYEVVKYYLDRIEKYDPSLNTFISICAESAIAQARKFDSKFKRLKNRKLGGIPLGIKDVYSTKWVLTTCASHMLDGYKPVFNATVIDKIKAEEGIVLGKNNLDQFCHGSGTTTSYYGASRNPWDIKKLPGGSSGGSASALSADLCAGAFGTETAGSIRLPSSWCGLVGLKPTYGRVSRYGVLAMGSSLDCPGPIAKSVKDAALLLEVIAGYDSKDLTTSKKKVGNYLGDLNVESIKRKKIAIPKQYLELELEEGVRKNLLNSIEILKDLGATVEEVDILDPKYAIAVYTVTCRSEVASNLARYDGTRFGLEGSKNDTITDLYESTRGEGFGDENKRRIMTGTFSLSTGFADEFFKKSEKVRQLIKNDLDNVLHKYDAIVAPTTPSTALSDKDAENPLFGENADILAEASSEAGLPGITIPSGLSNKMPTGVQFIGRRFDEQMILNIAYGVEKSIGRLIPDMRNV